MSHSQPVVALARAVNLGETVPPRSATAVMIETLAVGISGRTIVPAARPEPARRDKSNRASRPRQSAHEIHALGDEPPRWARICHPLQVRSLARSSENRQSPESRKPAVASPADGRILRGLRLP